MTLPDADETGAPSRLEEELQTERSGKSPEASVLKESGKSKVCFTSLPIRRQGCVFEGQQAPAPQM